MRRDGSYIYEEFLTTGGTDVKVGHCHALTLPRASIVLQAPVAKSPAPLLSHDMIDVMVTIIDLSCHVMSMS